MFAYRLDAHLGLVLAKFQIIAAISDREIKKKAKKAHFYSILLYKPILKSVKNLFLICLLIHAHLGLVLAKFQVIAAIFEREIKKKVNKAHFYQYACTVNKCRQSQRVPPIEKNRNPKRERKPPFFSGDEKSFESGENCLKVVGFDWY